MPEISPSAQCRSVTAAAAAGTEISAAAVIIAAVVTAAAVKAVVDEQVSDDHSDDDDAPASVIVTAHGISSFPLICSILCRRATGCDRTLDKRNVLIYNKKKNGHIPRV